MVYAEIYEDCIICNGPKNLQVIMDKPSGNINGSDHRDLISSSSWWLDIFLFNHRIQQAWMWMSWYWQCFKGIVMLMIDCLRCHIIQSYIVGRNNTLLLRYEQSLTILYRQTSTHDRHAKPVLRLWFCREENCRNLLAQQGVLHIKCANEVNRTATTVQHCAFWSLLFLNLFVSNVFFFVLT